MYFFNQLNYCQISLEWLFWKNIKTCFYRFREGYVNSKLELDGPLYKKTVNESKDIQIWKAFMLAFIFKQ